jgi:tetratricopeptide (TPR) repeat protein
MKRIKSSLLILLIIQTITLSAQQLKYSIDTTRSGSKMLFGEVTPNDFLQEPFRKWFDTNAEAHEVDELILSNKLKKALSKYEVTVYMGTWCGDSRKEVPRIIKSLEAANYDMSKLTIHTLNQSKQGKNREDLGQNIHRVPAIVFSKSGKEKGRIVEHPVVSIEQDISDLITSKKYHSNYHGLEVLHHAIAKKGFDIINNDKLVAQLKTEVKKDYELSKVGVIYFRNQEYEKALAIYDLNAKIFPKSDRPYQSKGLSYYAMEDLGKAKTNFKKALDMNPENKYAKKYLELIAEKSDDELALKD